MNKKYNMRKPKEDTKLTQGLKIGIYGCDGTGKSHWVLNTFNNICVIDTESKIGVYEKTFGKNIASILDTNDYESILNLLDDLTKDKDLRNSFDTVFLDSENNMFDTLQTYFTSLEETKAIKAAQREKIKERKGRLTEEEIAEIRFNSAITIRGYGKVRTYKNTYRSSKVQLSSLGLNVVTTAHAKPVKNKDGVIIDWKAGFIDDGNMHEYDLVLYFKKERNFDGGYNYIVVPKKDTIGIFTLEKEIDSDTSSEILKNYLSENYERPTDVKTNYKNIVNEVLKEEDEINETGKEVEEKENYINKLKELYKTLSEEQLQKSKEFLNGKKLNELNLQEIKEFCKVLNINL